MNNYHFYHPGNYHIHLHITGDGTERISQKLDLIIEQNKTIMADLTKLEADVTANSTVIGSAITLLQGLKQKLDEAGTDATKLAALSASLEGNTDALSAAVAANTPAETPAQ